MSDGSFVKVSMASDLIRFPDLKAQEIRRALESAKSGILIGRTRGLPYFLDLDNVINPHIFVCGITGSGKTYLMRNLMLKLAEIRSSTIALIDFTGEYENFVRLIGEKRTCSENFAESLAAKGSGVLYLNLAEERNQKSRVSVADKVLSQVIENMRMRSGDNRKVFVMLDEAWKLLDGSKVLQSLLREGRKYGYGLIFSSQLAEDMDLAMLSNAATIFVFRLQNRQGLRRLAANYGLGNGQVEMIQELGVGSCMVMQSLATGKMELCLVEKVHGIEFEETLMLKTGDKTRFEITKSKLEDAMREVCGEGAASEALHAGEKNGYVDLSVMIAALLDKGTRGRKLLGVLRKLGIDEDALADSFAIAVSSRLKE